MTLSKKVRALISGGAISLVASFMILGSSLPVSAGSYVCKTYMYSAQYIYYRIKFHIYNGDFQHMHNIYMLDSNQSYRQSVTLKPGESATLYVTATSAAGYQINNATGTMVQKSTSSTSSC